MIQFDDDIHPLFSFILANMNNDCLMLKHCGSRKHLSLGFWIRLFGGNRILATGSYTNSDSGPGVLIEYIPEEEKMIFIFQTNDRLWTVSHKMYTFAWYHVTIAWDDVRGLRVVLDGDVIRMRSMKRGIKARAENGV